MSNIKQTKHYLDTLCAYACSPYNDGWSASGYKKDLVMLKHHISKLIKKCPSFGALEDEWEKEIMIEILKEK